MEVYFPQAVDEDLRAELHAMVETGRLAFAAVEALMKQDRAFEEELLRRSAGGLPLVLLDWPDAPAAFCEMVNVDIANTQRFLEIVGRSGWPGIELVGADGEEAAWELAMHADTAQRQRHGWLALVELAASSGDVPRQHAELLRLRYEAVQALTSGNE